MFTTLIAVDDREIRMRWLVERFLWVTSPNISVTPFQLTGSYSCSNSDSSMLDMVFSRLSPCNLVLLLRVNRQIWREVTGYMRRTYSVERILKPFFSSPEAFRELQARTGTLVSGSSAVQFFDRSFYPDSDLDLYVDLRYLDATVAFLEEEGYTLDIGAWKEGTSVKRAINYIKYAIGTQLIDEPWVNRDLNFWGTDWSFRERYDSVCIGGVLSFSKAEKVVQIMIPRVGASPLAIILEFHSSKFDAHARSHATFLTLHSMCYELYFPRESI